MSKIEIDSVSKIFGDDPVTIVPLLDEDMSKSDILEKHEHVVGLRKVSLNIEAGEIFVIMGLSGSGKSTLIRHLNRLIDPTSGAIRIDGIDIMSVDMKELQHLRQTKLSMVFQRFALMPHRTVLENVAYGLEVRGDELKSREEEARKWIGKVGLDGYEDRYPSELSGGMQQRVGLARGLATNPDVLLMDEAFSALDPLIRHDMQHILLDLQNELHKTVVFITHDLDEALAIGDRIAILHDGVLVQVGTPEEIVLRPADDYVRRFVHNVNRSRALRVEAIMGDAVPLFEGPSIPRSSFLEEILPKFVSNEDGLVVVNEDGSVCGHLTLASTMDAIAVATND